METNEKNTGNRKRKLITSALPYVNNVPHLGNLIQVLSADVFARFCRLRGFDTLYICGTDEYGTATETRAQEEGKTPRELCDFYYKIHRDIYNWFGISFDLFGRTSTPQQTEVTQRMFLDLQESGFIREHTMQQLYCPSCGRFLADRYVRGTCPSCGYEDARGDQCESCGKLLDPVDLTAPRCSSCGSRPELRETRHLYIDLPAILPQYEKWMQKASAEGRWSRNALQMTQAWIRDGLQERAITRDLKWGIPVPAEGYENKVFYVWFDAPIGYISITKCLSDAGHFPADRDWKSWWQNPDEVELFQFIGKDNIPFHTVIFPSTLIGSNRNWTKLYHMSSTEYLNYESGKFSKSKGVGVFGTDAKESGIPADLWRFYMFYNRPEKADTQFTWSDFQERVNSDLIGNLGNLVNRTLTFVARYYGGKIPDEDGAQSVDAGIRAMVLGLREEAAKACAEITAGLEWAELRDSFRRIFALSSAGNKAFQDCAPWKARTENPEKAAALLRELCYLIRDIAIMLHPYMPDFASKIASFFGQEIFSGRVFPASGEEHTPEASVSVPAGMLGWKDVGVREGLSAVVKTEIIYTPLDNRRIDAYRERYSGSQKERNAVRTDPSAPEKAAKPEKPVLPPEKIFHEKIALKTAKIVKIEKHPDAEKLYIETLDDGSGEERVIVSGLVPYFAPEELLGKSIIIADNLKPRKMRGVESRGMLLAGDYTDAEGKERVEVLDSSWAKPGTPVVLEGDFPPCEKPDVIDADTFFSAPMEIRDFTVQINGIRLLIDGRPVRLQNIKEGSVS